MADEVVQHEQVARTALREQPRPRVREPRVVDEARPLGPVEDLVAIAPRDARALEPCLERRAGMISTRERSQGDLLRPMTAEDAAERPRQRPVELEAHHETHFGCGSDRDRPPRASVELHRDAPPLGPECGDPWNCGRYAQASADTSSSTGVTSAGP